MDPLSELLSLLRPRSTISSRLDAGGDWSISFGGQREFIKCYVVLVGECWLAVDGVADPIRVGQGDCFILPSRRPFCMASELALPPVGAQDVFGEARDGGIARIGTGSGFSMFVSRFSVGGRNADMLLQLLPPIVHLRKEADQVAVLWSVERLMRELQERRPAGDLIKQDLARMMLVQALRTHLADGPRSGTGWFFALADKRLSLAIAAIHAEPARNWTLRDLGTTAGMSRSVFALRFKQVVGETPMQYLTRWRMLLACDRLERSGDSIAAIAEALGYESGNALSTAFRRVMGCSPRQYGREPEARAIPKPTRAEVL